ncbi:hypothetical protein AB1Y20_021251 [Prymnesium parvum]|uniref:Uncharacterized protein n=1 Tax=Prymnesium parvum TaxID=97485 RepID=A0AB34JK41_PRYPA
MAAGVLAEVAASTAAGCVSTALGHPLDCIKVQLQAAQSAELGTLRCAVQMLQDGGVRAFGRGLASPLANAVLMNSVMFVAFAEARRRMPDGAVGGLLAGGFSGLVSAFLSTPFDLVKIQMQLGAKESAGRMVRRLLRTQAHSLFTGHTANMLREGVFTAVYLGLYDTLRSLMTDSSGHAPLMLVAAASASTGALAWVTAYPFDAVKSLQQAQPLSSSSAARLSFLGATRQLYARGGYAAFYRGVSASTARAILVTCSRLVTYEFVTSSLT